MAQNDTATRPPRLMPEQAGRLLLKTVPEPPIAHAYHHWDESTRTLSYTYNGRRLVSIRIPGSDRVSFRHGSDGVLQSLPFVQQAYIIVSGAPVTATVAFELSADAVNMLPRRAASEQAIVGQVGRPLLPDVHGLYDLEQDMLLGWFGRPWRWLESRLTPNGHGNLTARLEVELGPKTWIVTFRPHYYASHLGYHYHRPWQRRPNLKPIVGWCTWEAHRRNVSEEKVVAAARFFARQLRAYGFEYVQIDDGFERLPLPDNPKGTLAEAWLQTTDAFPGGHTGAVQKIRACGLEAGIWTSAAIYNDEFAEEQADCLLKDEQGQPLLGDWVKYVLDCTPASLEKHVRPYYAGLKEAGYTYFKVDAIRHLHYDGLHEAVLSGLLRNEEAEARFRRFLEVGREALGPDIYWLSSWGVLSQMVGLCDACRISQDAMPTWAGMQMQIVESARWFFTQRVLWLNDPDHVCVRAPLEWSRTVLSLVALTGGLFMLSDAIEEYDEPRLDLIRRCIPPLPTVTGETGPLDSDYAAFTWTKFHGFHVLEEKPFDAETMTDEEARNQAGDWPTINDAHPFSTLWAVHLDTAVGRWCVVGRFAAIALAAARVRFADLRLEPGQDYLVFDFWQRRYVGRFREGFDCPALALGHCQVLSVRPALDRPQLLSSTRHVSQDVISVLSQAWSGDTLTFDLEGVRGSSEWYWVHVPAGFELAEVDADGVEFITNGASTDAAGGRAISTRVDFPAGDSDRVTGRLSLRFANV